jgi:hypothetical protein
MKIFSPCFYPTLEPADLFLKSAAANGLNVDVYGLGEVPDTHGGGFQLEKPWEILAREKQADYVMVTDSRDVLMLAGEDEIVEKFLTFHAPIVISTEREQWPYDPALYALCEPILADPAHSRYVFANSGQIVGEWDAMRDAYRFLLDNYRNKPFADREPPGHDVPGPWWMLARMRGQIDYANDDQFKLFYTMSARSLEDTLIEGKRIVSRETGERPASIHFNGDKSGVAFREMAERLFG